MPRSRGRGGRSPEGSQHEPNELGEVYSLKDMALATLSDANFTAVKAVVGKMFEKKHNGADKGWGWATSTIKKKFTDALPKEFKASKQYKEAVSGISEEEFPMFAKNFVELLSAGSAEKAAPQVQPVKAPQEQAEPEQQKPWQESIADTVEKSRSKKEEFLNAVVPKFNKSKTLYASSEDIFTDARNLGIVPSQAVRFLFENYGFGDRFVELRKNKAPYGIYKTIEQVLLRELVNLIEDSRERLFGEKTKSGPKVDYAKVELPKEIGLPEKYFITEPDATSNNHRYLIFDQYKGEGSEKKARRFKITLPLGVDIGIGQKLYQAGLNIAKLNKYKNAGGEKDNFGREAAITVGAKDFDEVLEKELSAEEKERIKNRKAFIETAKPLFDNDPVAFIKDNKLIELAGGIPNEDAVRYLVDESLIGGPRVKQYREFKDLIQKSSEELISYVGVEKELGLTLSRTQLELAVLAKLVWEAEQEKQKKKQGRSAVEQRMVEGIEAGGGNGESQEDLEKYENHPEILKAKAVVVKDIEEQMFPEGINSPSQQKKCDNFVKAFWDIEKESIIKNYLEAGLLS